MVKLIILSILILGVPQLGVSELLFSSGFEDATVITELSASKGFPYWHPTGTDASTGDNWLTTIDAIDHTAITIDGGLYGNFDNTWDTHELAEIVADPDDAGNDVMHFIAKDVPWIVTDPVEDSYYNSTRLSAALMYNYTGNLFTEGYVKYRVRFGEGFGALEGFGNAVDWLVISEIFEHDSEHAATWRINLNIHKESGVGEQIYWHLIAQDKVDGGWVYPYQWDEENTSFAVPVETWFTLEMYYKKGDASNGRFYVTVTPDGGSKQVLFDVTNYTHSTYTADNITSDWAIFKLYSSGGTSHTAADNGTPLEIWYDDLEYFDTCDSCDSCDPCGFFSGAQPLFN